MTKFPLIAATAIAGSLALAGCSAEKAEAPTPAASDTASDATMPAAEVVYTAQLSGAKEVKAGDPDGTGTAKITIAPDYARVCWDLEGIENIGPIKAAHVHSGPAGLDGPPVFELHAAADGTWKGCESGAMWENDRIDGNPQDFYVNVHTAEFPDGAIRGQLED